MKTPRGRKKASFQNESHAERLKKAKQFMRTDFGGKDPISWAKKWMAEGGIECSDKAAKRIVEAMVHVAEGIRKRSFDRIDSVIDFLEGREITEKI